MAVVMGDPNATLKELTVIAEQTVQQTQPTLYPIICSEKPEDGAYTKLPVATNVPFMRKLEGELSAQGKDVTVTQTYQQDTYELTLEFNSDLIRNAKAYEWSDLVREGTIRAQLFPDYLCTQMVINGGTNNGYDGNAYYGATHTYAKAGSNNIDNTVSRTGSTAPNLADDIASALTKLKTFKDNAGGLLNPMAMNGGDKLVIHCPVALEQRFRQVLFSETVPIAVPVTTSGTAAATAGRNQLQGIAALMPDGYLDANSATTWYMHYIGMPQKPFVYLENYPLEVNVLGFGTEWQINNNTVRIVLKRRFVLGYYRFDRSVRVA